MRWGMSNYLCLITTKSLNDKNCIYKTCLKQISVDQSISNALQTENLYVYMLDTEVNYEKIKEAKTITPELYDDSQKMLDGIYRLAQTLLAENVVVALFLTHYNQNRESIDWQVKSIPLSYLTQENVGFDFNNIYKLQKGS